MQEPTTQTLQISDAKNRLSDLVADVARGGTRVLFEQDGIAVAALVSAEDLKRLARLDEQRAERRRVVAAMREPFRGVPPEEIERAAAEAVADVRAEMRAEREATAASR
jgi:prevent-host-death family protein